MAARSELIGLEATAKPKWLRELLACFTQLEAEGLVFDERVLHINGSGFVASLDLGLALQDFGLNQLKLSRCHDDEVVNQQIMCVLQLQPLPIRHNAVYAYTVRELHQYLAVKSSYILTRSGIATLHEARFRSTTSQSMPLSA